jgi:hypothetical protein
MPEPVTPQQNHDPDCPDVCEWQYAYLRLREVVTDARNAATPAKYLCGSLTIVDTWLARDLRIPLSALYDHIQADFDKTHKPKDATTGADRAVEPL